MTPPTRLFIIRHAETVWNSEGRAMGWLDSPLSPVGEEQARALARRAASAGIQRLVTSDLGRARATAEAVSRACGTPAALEPGLRERCMGLFQGLTVAERTRQYPAEVEAYRALGERYVIPQGESGLQFADRTWEALQRIARDAPGERILVVTHGGVLLSLFERLFQLPWGSGHRFLRPNAAWNQFSVTESCWRLEVWGDVTHLETLESSGGNDPSVI